MQPAMGAGYVGILSKHGEPWVPHEPPP
jgi:hypothetical protein